METVHEGSNSIRNLSFESLLVDQIINLTLHLDGVGNDRHQGSKWEHTWEKDNVTELHYKLHIIIKNFEFVLEQGIGTFALELSDQLLIFFFFCIKSDIFLINICLIWCIFISISFRCIFINSWFKFFFEWVKFRPDKKDWSEPLK